MDFEPVNMNAAEDALRLIGGDDLVRVVTMTYEAMHRAELRGVTDGFDEGHRIGVIDGRAQAERELGISASFERPGKENAHVEGEDWTHLIHSEGNTSDQPSDEGLAGLSETF